jgi:hypothetical protein
MSKDTLQEKAIKNVAKAISVLDLNTYSFDNLKSGKQKISQARKLLYGIIKSHGFALKMDGTIYKLKS